MTKSKKKFENVEFSPEDIELWLDTLHDGRGFRCVRSEFVTFLRKGRIAREVQAHLCQCWILRSQEDLAGYITLLADKLTVEEQILLPEGIKYRTFPAIKIGLLATEQRCKGVGSILVQWAIQYVVYTLVPLVGVRFITVDALYDPETRYDSSGFYQRCGFLYVNPAEILPPSSGYRTMYFDLKPLLDTLGVLG